MKILYYLKHAFLELIPSFLFYFRQCSLEKDYANRSAWIQAKVDYYCKIDSHFSLNDKSTKIFDYKRKGYTSYYFDLKEFLHYFPKSYRFNYYFGDETHIESVPTLFKARPIEGNNANSVLFKLDKRRHFRFVEDRLSFSDKKDAAVFRGAVTQPHRARFMKEMFGHPLVDAGQSNSSEEHPEWQKPFMSVEEQLQYKFLICLEGNDVASNLKWAMSSNSVVVTPKMKYETWFMEGTLQAGVHYIEVKDDWSDFEEKIQYYIDNPLEAEKIVKNAHDYIAPFKDEKLEQLVCIKTLERYFELSGQLEKKKAMEKILIVGPSWVGDMVMSQGLYIELKKQYPDSQIDVLAPAWCKAILERMPQVDQALEMPLGHGQFDLKTRYQMGKRLRNSNYTQAYVLPNSAKSALIPFFAKIPQRVGWKGEMRFGLLNDIRTNKKSFHYMLERYVALAHSKSAMTGSGCLGELKNLPYPALSLQVDTQQATMQQFGLTEERPILGLCPGAEFGPAKRWPGGHFARVASEMINKGYQVWLFGSAKDREVTSAIIEQVAPENQQHCYNLAGSTSLVQAVDLIGACQTVVSNDSGLMHVAAAVGCNVVAIYGSSSPQYTPPLTDKLAILNTDIECRPCFERTCPKQHLKCLQELMPEKVIQAIIKLDALVVG